MNPASVHYVAGDRSELIGLRLKANMRCKYVIMKGHTTELTFHKYMHKGCDKVRIYTSRGSG